MINKITIENSVYPNKLRNIYDPPKELYYVGDINLLNNKIVAIIGCRKASKYGLKIAKIFSEELSKNGITIISGLAIGIDGEAHKNSLKNIGRTIAVLGSGLDIIYPESHIELCKEIINNGGLIISEFPLGTSPSKENFPKRNRIISALSDGVLVVEAKKRSGTMITVDFALEQGKDVFIVPGNIDSLNSEGTNNLIKEGAIMVTSYIDILHNFE
ncbi:MAG: DNA-processing protein DprA [Clostridia bacterium]|nr:DNA-processing protein DprA [Clostridia bacterium]